MKIIKFNHSNKTLWYHIGELVTSDEVAKDLEYPIRSNENCIWYVIFDMYQVVGFCCSESKNGYKYFKCDFIVRDKRGCRYYSELFKRRLSDNLGNEIRVTCNKNSIKTYLKNGFVEVSKNGKYTKLILK